ncbi:MAG: hypothetical protein MRY83_03825 [Flavobacteriales bacterium]|nr:hypothetical protein [Flavobacteriales bacterium]
MKGYFLIWTLLVVNTNVNVVASSLYENKIDSLHNELGKNHTVIEKINCYNVLSTVYTHKNPDSSLLYSKLALKLSRLAKNDSSIGISLSMVARSYLMLYQDKVSEMYYDSALRYMTVHASKKDLCSFYIDYANILCYNAKFDESFEWLNKALEVASLMRDTSLLSLIHSSNGNVYGFMNRYDESLAHRIKAMNYEKVLDSTSLEYYFAVTDVGITYNALEQNAKAIKYLFKAIGSDKIKLRPRVYSDIMAVLGEAYYNLGILDSAEWAFKQSLTMNTNPKESSAYQNLIIMMCEVQLSKDNPSFIEDYISLINEYSGDGIIDAHNRKRGVKVLRDYYFATGDLNKAYELSIRHNELSDSVNSIKNKERILQVEAKFGAEREKKENQLLQAKNQLLKQENYTNKKIIRASVLGSLILLVIALTMHFLFRKNKKLNKHLNASLAQNKMLIKEIHHRVKNNLQMVSTLLDLQTENTNDPAAINALQEGQNRVHSVALIHQKLYQDKDVNRVDFYDYTSYLSNHLSDIFFDPSKSIEVKIDIERNLMMDIDLAIPLSLILNELITNSFKYAFNKSDIGVISISLEKYNEIYTFSYSDNGSGFDPDKVSSNSLGMKLITILTEQLKGALSWNNVSSTNFSLKFKEQFNVQSVA